MLGYVVAWFVADEGQIANLAVAPAGWGSGIGRALLDAALREAVAARRDGRVSGGAGLERSARGGCTGRADSRRSAGGAATIGVPVEDAIVLRRTLTQADV